MPAHDDMAMAMTLMAQYDHRAAKEARGRRRHALIHGDGAEAKYWRAVHKQIVRMQSEQPHERDHKGKS